MPLAKCIRCSKMFNKQQSPVCSGCQSDEDADQTKVREVIDRSPELNAEQVAEEAGVDIAVVRRMLQEGVIVSTALTGNVQCGRCGAPAISASKKLCQACLEKLNIEVAKAQADIKLTGKKRVEIGEYDMNVRKTLDQKRGAS